MPEARTWRTWQLVVAAVVSLLIGVGIGAAGKTKDATTVTATQTTASTVAAETTTTAPPATTAAPTTTLAPTTRATTGIVSTTPAPKGWVAVATLSGSGEKRGDNFHLSGGQSRLRYSSSSSALYVYLVKGGDSLDKSGGFPEVSCSAPCEDQTRLANPAGDYYLDVRSVGSWTVSVEELK